MNPNIKLPKTKFLRVYTALLNQTDTNDPVARILQNTLGAVVSYTRTGTGNYLALVSFYEEQDIPINETGVIISGHSEGILQTAKRTSASEIGIYTWDTITNAYIDNKLLDTFFEIRIYT